MPLSQVDFIESWYDRLVSRTNEKSILPDAIRSYIGNKRSESCLEIGLGTSPIFADKLADLFQRYVIIEKRLIVSPIPNNASLVAIDWESLDSMESYDVIIASHVIYYFRDKEKAIKKILASLTPGGRAFIVVNGKDGDYGPLKQAFADMIGQPYRFTYDELRHILGKHEFLEHTIPSSVGYSAYDDLFETLRISFDQYPEEYERFKPKLLEYFEHTLNGKPLIINQKIFEISAI